MQPSLTVEINWPAIGPKLSFAQLSSFFYLLSSYSFIFFDSSDYFFYYWLFSYLFTFTASIFSMIKTTPIICSLARGPDAQASQKPFLTDVINYFTVVL